MLDRAHRIQGDGEQHLGLHQGHLTILGPGIDHTVAWSNTQHAMASGERRVDCPCCGEDVFDWLDGRRTTSTMELCGRDAVQIKPPSGHDHLPLQVLADRLAVHGRFRCTPEVLHGRFTDEDIELTVFPNGRALVKGSQSLEHARSVYARYIGN